MPPAVKRERNSLVSRIRQGAPTVSCSSAMALSLRARAFWVELDESIEIDTNRVNQFAALTTA